MQAVRGLYSQRFAQWAARVLLRDFHVRHAWAVLLRHVRLLGASPERQHAHSPGALLRQLALALHSLETSRLAPPPPRDVLQELTRLASLIRKYAGCPQNAVQAERLLFDFFFEAWGNKPNVSGARVIARDPVDVADAESAGTRTR